MKQKKLTPYQRGIERGLLLCYEVDPKWTHAELLLRYRILRIMSGRKSTRPVMKKRNRTVVYDAPLRRLGAF